jgi:hypothetical protein
LVGNKNKKNTKKKKNMKEKEIEIPQGFDTEPFKLSLLRFVKTDLAIR